jgi:hypothetical protein
MGIQLDKQMKANAAGEMPRQGSGPYVNAVRRTGNRSGVITVNVSSTVGANRVIMSMTTRSITEWMS